LIAIATDDEPAVRELLFAAVPAELRYQQWTSVTGVSNARVTGDPVANTEHPAAALAWLAGRTPGERFVAAFYDLLPHLDDPRTRRALKELVERARLAYGTVILVDAAGELPAPFESEARRFELSPVDDAELELIFREILADVRRTRSVAVDLRKSTFRKMGQALRGLSRGQTARVVRGAIVPDDKLCEEDLPRMLRLKRNALGDLGGILEFLETPVTLDEIGGLAALKRWLADRSGALAAEAVAAGIRAPRGVLILGVQGTGKSLAAKAIATAWSMPLLRLDAGALYDRFVGESERRLRDSLRQADRMAPAVIWIDEIEKGFAGAASTSSDGGLSRRMFGTLLTWMQERTAPTFLAATANDVTALPPELLRKGRFDEVFFVDLPSAEARAAILAIHLRRRGRDPASFDLAAVAATADSFSGAELEAVVERAVLTAFADGRRPLKDADLIAAAATSPPLAVTMAERVAELRAWAQGRCVPAD
jgi:SpoVK/Ycf46/Vps4 family AAA+-type ATPase